MLIKKMETRKHLERQIFPNLFTVVTLAITVISVADTKAIDKMSTVNTIGDNPILNASRSVQVNLTETLVDLNSKYKETLLNETLLPFLGNCTNLLTATSSLSPSTGLSNTHLLCLVYYDMIFNLGKSGFNDYRTQPSVTETIVYYDNITLVKNFCDFFAGEIPTEEENRPFESRLGYKNISSGQILKPPQSCSLFCYQLNERFAMEITPVCKLISGGYRVIKRHLIDKDDVIPEMVQKPQITQTADGQVAGVAASGDDKIKNEASLKLPTIQTAVEAKLPSSPQEEPKIGGELAKIPLVKTVSTPNLAVSAPAIINQTSDPVAVQLSSDKAVTKEMKPSLNVPETVPVPVSVDIDAVEKSKIQPDLPEDEEESEYGAFPNDQNDKTEKLSETGVEIENNDIAVGSVKNIDPDGDDDDDDADSLPRPKVDDAEAQPDVQPNESNNHMQNDKPKIAVPGNSEQYLSQGQAAEIIESDPFFEDTDSNFFSYFMFLLLVCAIVYVVYHNKTKVLALMVEGRRSRGSSSRGNGRRKHRAAYRKLDCNLEEAIQSSGQISSSQVIY